MHRRLLSLTRDTRISLALTILSGFLIGLLTIWQAWTLSGVIDSVFLRRLSLTEVAAPLGMILLAIGGRALLTWLNEVAANAVAVKIKTDLRDRLFDHILKLGPAYTRGQRTGELSAAAVEGIEALDAYFSQYLPQLVITALVPLSILVFVFPIDLLTGFVFLITAPLIPFFMIIIGKGAEAVTHRQYQTLQLLSSHFLDSLQGLTTLKIFGQSKGQAKNIAQVSERFRDVTMSVLRITFLSALALELLATLSTAVVAVEIGFRLLYAKMEFQPALFLLVLAPEFYMPLRALGARFHAGMNGTTAAKRIYEILDTPVVSNQLPVASSQLPVTSDQLSVTSSQLLITNLSFTYPNESTPALDNINLTIKAGGHIALVGKTGAGKSTLVNLLLGFMQPTAGEIHPSSFILHPFISWVPQKPYLFHDTIAENIKLGKQDATQEEIIAAAKAARLHDFIESLPQKYETVIGENGARLSSGQAQRLALARAFLKDAPILILDEPTSSLDPETESLLEESTRELMRGRTTITIAHRLNTIAQSDQIIVLDEGRIVEQGTHQELLAKNGLYASMVKGYEIRDTSYKLQVTGDKLQVTDEERQPSSFIFHPSSFAPHSTSSIFSRLLSFLQGNWNRVALSVIIGAGTVGSSVALMGTSSWLISTAALHPSVADLGVSVVGVRFFGIARGLLRYAERLVSHDVTFRLLARLRVWFYEKLEPLAPARLMEFRAGDLLARIIGDVETLENFYVRIVSPPLTALLVGIFTAIFLAVFHPLFAFSFVVFFLAAGLILPALAQIFSRKAGARAVSIRAELHSALVDGIQGMADLLAYGRAENRLSQIATLGKHYGSAQKGMAAVTGIQSALSLALTQLAAWTILFLAIPQVTAGNINGVMLASLTLLTLAAFEAVTPLPLAAQMWNAARQAAQRLFEVVDMDMRGIDNRRLESRGLESRGLENGSHPGYSSNLYFSNISFSYPNTSTPALDRVTFDLKPSTSIAIVGPSGAGKSTIANLLLRFWDYESGEILLGGTSLKLRPQDEVRAQMGYVSQNAYFFNASIYENLRFARRKVTREEVEAAAQAAQIHDFIMSLPKGYETMIGEQGLRLSGGERQRLGIARALIKDAPILILDEPTANLDALTERDVLETLFGVMKRKTSILITHRLIGLENMDEILVMNHGQIVERGTHAELSAQNGLYARLLNLQNRVVD